MRIARPTHPNISARALAHWAIVAGIGLALGCANQSEPAVSASQDAIATVDGVKISLAEVDQKVRDDLFEQEFGSSGGGAKLYDARRDAISILVEEILLGRAAAETEQSPDEWLDAAALAKGAVSEQEIETFFQQNRARLGAGATLESLSGRIRSYLEQNRYNSIYDDLRAAASIEVNLPRNRVQVAATGPAIGPDDAPVTIVEFSDFQCPYCSKAAMVMKQVIERYPEEVRLVYRHLPLEFHANARDSASASLCANAQGRFWDYHDLLFENQRALQREKLMQYAAELSLDMELFEACITDPQTLSLVDDDLAAAGAVGATGTPAFFVNGIMLSGAQPFDVFESLIEEELGR